MLTYKTELDFTCDHIFDLYADVGWTNYTKDKSKLHKSIQHSVDVITAWEGDELVGLIRTIGDQHTIMYIQDILVKTSHQRRGIGRALIQMIEDKYPDVRQLVLLTDDQEKESSFYTAIGFQPNDALKLKAFVKIR